MFTRSKLIGTIALGAALLVPVAQAQSPDDQAGMRGPGGISALQAQTGATNHPDNRAVHGPGATKNYDWRDFAFSYGNGIAAVSTDVAVRPDDRSGLRGPGAFPEGVVVQTDSPGFDWGDAMIGSLGGLGAALLLTGGLLLLTSQRNKARLA